MFRAGLVACREYMARFVEPQSPEIAASIRANWWPSLGPDFGRPRKIAFQELTEGEWGTEAFRAKEAGEVPPTLEALPIALQFLMQSGPPGAYDDLLTEHRRAPTLHAIGTQEPKS